MKARLKTVEIVWLVISLRIPLKWKLVHGWFISKECSPVVGWNIDDFMWFVRLAVKLIKYLNHHHLSHVVLPHEFLNKNPSPLLFSVKTPLQRKLEGNYHLTHSSLVYRVCRVEDDKWIWRRFGVVNCEIFHLFMTFQIFIGAAAFQCREIVDFLSLLIQCVCVEWNFASDKS